MKRTKRIFALLLIMSTLITVMPLSMLPVFATGGNEGVDAMEEIDEKLSGYKVGQTEELADDGYIGIPVGITVYFDSAKHEAVGGYNGTPLIIYVVNTLTERIGTESDFAIIKDMLDSGYIVYILDYKNSPKAVSQELDFSVQILRKQIEEGRHNPDVNVIPAGYYYENFVVPAGYTVSLGHIFYEIDKHSADGTLEKIVEIWNNDFKTAKGGSLVKWVHETGERKTVAAASDGSEPVWYDASGKVDPDGQYTKVKYTVAEVITDCVDPDGSPIELNQYMHIVYPTGGVKVPVMALANSSGRVTTAQTSEDVRPHMNGFLFNGYAGIVYDYLWTPMARSESFGYFDGSQGNTGDHMNYAVHVYNNVELDTAAIRYIRYLALSQSETFNFDTDAIGVIGNSKGGWFTFLGEAVLRKPLVDASAYSDTEKLEDAISSVLTSFGDNRVFPEHNGESRYENGKTDSYTEDGFTVDGGERQPWLTYDGKEILSGANFIYASNGSNSQDVTEGYAPAFIASHLYDTYNAAYGYTNTMINNFRNMDIPSLFFEVPLGHALTYGKDVNFGVDTYDALFDFCGYYLKNDPVKVVYVSPLNTLAGVKINDPVTVKFTGIVQATEVEKITVSDGEGNKLTGFWKSAYGQTEWTFYPTGMKGSEIYTVNIPSDIAGDNGKAMGTEYISEFMTENTEVFSAVSENNTVTVRIPELTDGLNRYELAFSVADDAANVAEVIAYDGLSDDEGTTLGTVNLKGYGCYYLDVTDYVADKVGKDITFVINGVKSAGESVIYNETFESSTGACGKGSYTTLSVEDGKLKAVISHNKGAYVNSYFYPSCTTVFSNNSIKTTTLSEEDYGRRFKVSFDVYDDVSRTLTVQTVGCTSKANGTIDYQRVQFNTRTVAGEWKTVEFVYTVYDSDYGVSGLHKQGFTVLSASDGANETPLYFDNIVITEVVTGVNVTEASLLMRDDGGIEYKAPVSEKAFAIFDGETEKGIYGGLKEAMTAYESGETLRLLRNCTVTDSELSDAFSRFEEVILDLNGFSIRSENTKAGLIWVKSTSLQPEMTVVTIRNGEISLKNTAAVSYEGSTASGSGKKVSVNFENVIFTFAEKASLTEAVSESTVPSGAKTDCKIKLDGCKFAFDDDAHAIIPSVILPEGSGGLTLSYKVTGGSLELSSQKLITVQKGSNHTEFLSDAEGNYMTLTMPSAVKPADTAYMRDDGFASYESGVSENGYTEYTLYKSEYSTKYGIIPEQYADVLAYPLVVFDGQGNCIGASSYIAKDTGGGALNFASKQSEGEWVIYLRRDLLHTDTQFNNLAFIYGSVLFDLGGNTITVAEGAGRFFDSAAKRGNTTSITVKNGTISTGSIAFVRFTSLTTGAYDGTDRKTFDYKFEDITFTDVGASSLFIGGNPTVGFDVKLSFIDCVFDISQAPDNFVLINLADPTNNLSAEVNLSGGLLKRSTFENVKLYGLFNSSSSVIFTRNTDGEYTVAECDSTGTAPSDNIPTPDGNMRYENGISAGEKTTYTLNVNPLATRYGIIPAEYADAETYPFVVFKDGEFFKADTSWALAVSRLKDSMYGNQGTGQEMQILMRRDYTSTASDGTHGLWSLIGGNAVIDLNGFTFTRSSDAYFIDIVLKDTPQRNDPSAVENHDLNITVRNGRIISRKPILAINRGSDFSGDKKVNVVFEEVTVKPAADSLLNQVFVTWNDGGTSNGNASLQFIDCIFDLTEANSQTVLFSVNESSNLIDAEIVLQGGSIIAQKAAYSALFALGEGDRALFCRNESGVYTELLLPVSSGAPDFYIPTDDGKMFFGKVTASSEYIGYSPVKLSTGYGIIPEEYASPLDYPFVYFDSNGVFKSGSNLFYGTNSGTSIVGKAKEFLKGNIYDSEKGEYTGDVLEAYILMRRDYELAENENFDNLSQIQGKLNIDLNGYKLVSPHRAPFPTCVKGWSGSGDAALFPSEITIKDGTIITKNNAVLSFSVWNSVGGDNATAMLDKKFSYVFDKVSFRLTDGSSAVSPLISYSKYPSTPDAVGNVYVDFNECVFDYRTVISTKPITVFNADPASGGSKIIATVTVNGGEVAADDLSTVTLASVGDGSSLLFGKDASGNYTSFVFSLTSQKPTDKEVFETDEGTLTLMKSEQTEETVKYTLGSAIETAYGKIPAVYADAADYPFAVFSEGEFVGAYSKWGETGNNAVNVIKGEENRDKTVTVLLRRDYINTGDTFWSLTQAGGTFVLDLGGYTFTRDSVFIDLSAGLYLNTVFPTDIVVKNGTVLALEGTVVASQYVIAEGLENKVFNLKFENVTFGFAEGATTKTLMWVVWDNGRDNEGGKVSAVFENCVFDMETNAPDGNITLFNLTDKFDRVDITAVLQCGKIIAPASGDTVLVQTNGENDSLLFGEYAESYTTLTSVNGNAPTDAYYTVDGQKVYFNETDNAGEFILGPCEHKQTGEWQSDLSGHWKVCTVCQAVIDEGVHIGGTATCTDKAVCEVCGSGYGETDPDGHKLSSEWKTDGTYHWKECENGCGIQVDKGEHSGGTATCTDKAVCEVCGSGYGAYAAHVYDQKITANQYISREATCTEPTYYHYSCICGKSGTAEFASGEALGHTGGTATCEKCAVCTRCGIEYGEPVGHIPDENLTFDSIGHWVNCTVCGKQISEKEQHIFGEWTVIRQPTSTESGEKVCECETCGYSISETIPETAAAESKVTVNVSGGSIEGHTGKSVTVNKDESLTLTAGPAPEGKIFKGWSDGTKIVSTESTYTFSAENDVTLTAVYEDEAESGKVNAGVIAAVAAGAVVLAGAGGFAVSVYLKKKKR